MARKPPKLDTLQVGRGLAALAVLLFHSEVVTQQTHPASPLASVFNLGFTGVDFFFLLSGFLMLWVHRADFDQPKRLAAYFTKRFSRIYPVYWFLCLFLVPLTIFSPALRTNQAASAGSTVASILLLPHPGNRLLGVTWTLEYELLFYLVFAVFFLSSRAAVALFSTWFAAIVLVAIRGPLPAIPTGAPLFLSSFGWLIGFVLNLHLVEFFVGMLIAWSIQRSKHVTHPRVAFTLAILLLVAAQSFILYRGSFGIEQGHRLVTLVAGTLFALLLFSAVQWELSRSGRSALFAGPLQILGAASYSIYLTHFLVISFVKVLAHRSPRIASLPAAAQFAFIVVVGVIPGLLLHLAVERPLLAFSGRRLQSHSSQPAAHF